MFITRLCPFCHYPVILLSKSNQVFQLWVRLVHVKQVELASNGSITVALFFQQAYK